MAKGTTVANSAPSAGSGEPQEGPTTNDEFAFAERRELDVAEQEPPEFGKKMLLQLGAGVLVGALLLAAYGWYQKRSHAAKLLVVEARELIEKMDVPSLRQAEAKLLEALALQSSNEQVLSTLAELYALLWIEHGFVDIKPKAIEYTSKAVDSGVENEQRFVAEAMVLYGEGRYNEADALLQSINARGAVSEQFYWVHALTDVALGKPDLAREKLRRAADLKASTPHYARHLGDAYDDAADDRNALVYWDKSAKVNSNYIQGVARDLLTHLKNDFDRKAVLDELARFATLKPEDVGPVGRAAVQHARATMLLQEAKYDDALAAIGGAIEAAGETARYLSTRGRILIASGKAEEGLKDLAAARQKAPKADRYLYVLASAYIDLGKPTEAVKLLQGAAAGRDEDVQFWVELGAAQLAAGDLKAAKKSYDKALELQSNHPYALLGRGKVAWKERDYDGALPWFEKGVAAKAKFPELYEAIGLMWVEQGALSQAQPQLEMAEKLYKATQTEAWQMKRFYASVVKTFASASGGSSYARDWAAREQAYDEQLKNPVQAKANNK